MFNKIRNPANSSRSLRTEWGEVIESENVVYKDVRYSYINKHAKAIK